MIDNPKYYNNISTIIPCSAGCVGPDRGRDPGSDTGPWTCPCTDTGTGTGTDRALHCSGLRRPRRVTDWTRTCRERDRGGVEGEEGKRGEERRGRDEERREGAGERGGRRECGGGREKLRVRGGERVM